MSADADAAPAPTGSILAGASSRSVLPRVDGGVGYLQRELPGLRDAVSPGVFIPELDDGRVAVGNGDSEAHWVHDDVRARALALQRPGNRKVVALLATDLYMIFRADADAIRAEVERRLPASQAGKVEVFIGATHNHHGPDTAFDVNHAWYDSMIDRAAAAVVEAVARMRPARLRVGQGRHWFGMDDGTDPQIIDPRMNVLQATGIDGRVIGTVVQWNNHPETTLGLGAAGRHQRRVRAARLDRRPVHRRGPVLHRRLPRRARPHHRPAGRGRDALLRRRARPHRRTRAAPPVWEVDAPTRSATSSTRRLAPPSRAGPPSPTPTTTSAGPSSSASRPPSRR